MPDAPTIALVAQLFAGGTYAHTAANDVTRFDLDRAELGAEPAWGERAGGELRLETVRSADPQSTIGVDGDSLVVRAKRAWLWGRWQPGPATLELRAGLVPEPWIEAIEAGYALRPLAPTIGEEGGLLDSSDLGLAVAGTWDRVHAVVMIGNGEGRAQIEQNKGKDTTAEVTVHVADLGGARLDAHVYGRDGSLGPASARAHRAAAAITLSGPCHDAGAEVMRAWGVGEQSDETAWAASGWGSATVWSDAARERRVGVAGRIGWTSRDGGAGADRAFSGIAAVWHDVVPDVRVFLAGRVTRVSGAGAPIPGIPDAVDETDVLLVVAGTGRLELK